MANTYETGTTTLSDHFKCPENTIASFISAIYPGINEIPHPPDDYFASHTNLMSRNDGVDDINEKMLSDFPGEEEFLSADSITGDGENGEGKVDVSCGVCYDFDRFRLYSRDWSQYLIMPKHMSKELAEPMNINWKTSSIHRFENG